MRIRHKMLVGCLLWFALECLSSSAQLTATEGTPIVTLNPAATVIAENQPVTVTYNVTVTLTGDSKAGSYTVNWSCYVNGDLYQGFPKPDSNSFLALAANFTVQGTFTISESQPGTYSVYCTASGEVADNGSTKNIGPNTSTPPQEFTVATCTGQLEEMSQDENPTEPPSYIQLNWTINATMNPAFSGSQAQTSIWYQGIDGDLTNHLPPLDINCQDGNNVDPPEQNPTFTAAGQEPGSGQVTFLFNAQEYNYTWDTCNPDSCPPPPPGGVGNVQVVAQQPERAQFIFQCGK